MKIFFILVLLLGTWSLAYSQQSPADNPNSRDPEIKQEQNTSLPSVKKHRDGKNQFEKYHDVKVEEYQKRMAAVAKKYRKMEKEMKKPQYSNPLYFGHKKMPKKRPPGKKKFCSECGMKH